MGSGFVHASPSRLGCGRETRPIDLANRSMGMPGIQERNAADLRDRGHPSVPIPYSRGPIPGCVAAQWYGLAPIPWTLRSSGQRTIVRVGLYLVRGLPSHCPGSYAEIASSDSVGVSSCDPPDDFHYKDRHASGSSDRGRSDAAGWRPVAGSDSTRSCKRTVPCFSMKVWARRRPRRVPATCSCT